MLSYIVFIINNLLVRLTPESLNPGIRSFYTTHKNGPWIYTWSRPEAELLTFKQYKERQVWVQAAKEAKKLSKSQFIARLNVREIWQHSYLQDKKSE